MIMCIHYGLSWNLWYTVNFFWPFRLCISLHLLISHTIQWNFTLWQVWFGRLPWSWRAWCQSWWWNSMLLPAMLCWGLAGPGETKPYSALFIAETNVSQTRIENTCSLYIVFEKIAERDQARTATCNKHLRNPSALWNEQLLTSAILLNHKERSNGNSPLSKHSRHRINKWKRKIVPNSLGPTKA